MGVSIRVNAAEIKRFKRKLNKLTAKSGAASLAGFMKRSVKEDAEVFKPMVQENTPVGSIPGYVMEKIPTDMYLNSYWGMRAGRFGNLRKSWKIKAAKAALGGYAVDVVNDAKAASGGAYYASFIEEGHNQAVGRYVRQIDGKLRRSFVDGYHFQELTEDDYITRYGAPQKKAAEIEAFIRGVLG